MPALQITLPLEIAILVAFLAIFWRQLNIAAQPCRLELAEKGEALLANQNVPSKTKKKIQFFLNTAFGMRWPLIGSIIIAPAAIPFLAFSDKHFASLDDRNILDASTKGLYDDVLKLQMTIAWCNNPILYSILCLEVAVFLLPSVLIRVLLGRGIPKFSEPGTVITLFEEKYYMLKHNQQMAAG